MDKYLRALVRDFVVFRKPMAMHKRDGIASATFDDRPGVTACPAGEGKRSEAMACRCGDEEDGKHGPDHGGSPPETGEPQHGRDLPTGTWDRWAKPVGTKACAAFRAGPSAPEKRRLMLTVPVCERALPPRQSEDRTQRAGERVNVSGRNKPQKRSLESPDASNRHPVRVTFVESNMTTKSGNQGGTHEQHVKAGEQSHKGSSGGASHEQQTHEQQSKAGQSSHGSSQGGTHEQHVKAGQQSHKNS